MCFGDRAAEPGGIAGNADARRASSGTGYDVTSLVAECGGYGGRAAPLVGVGVPDARRLRVVGVFGVCCPLRAGVPLQLRAFGVVQLRGVSPADAEVLAQQEQVVQFVVE